MQGSGWQRPLRPKLEQHNRVAKFVVKSCNVVTETSNKNALREFRRKLVRVAANPGAAAHNKNADSAGSSGAASGGGRPRTPERAAFNSQRPNPHSLGAASEIDVDALFSRSHTPVTRRAEAARLRVQAVAAELKQLYRSFVVDAQANHAGRPPPNADDARAMLTQCVREDLGGLHDRGDAARNLVLRRARSTNAALGVLLRGQGVAFDNVVRLTMLQWWEAHTGHRIYAMHQLQQASAGSGQAGDEAQADDEDDGDNDGGVGPSSDGVAVMDVAGNSASNTLPDIV